jgi:ABC-type multidrug transport system permease subunit
MRSSPPHPLIELTRVKVLEFVREPEAVFWVLIFPILMAFALGIAFRNRGDEPVRIGVLEGGNADALVSALARDPGVSPQRLSAARADRALRDGDVQLIVVPGDPPTYRFDPTRTESRLARLATDQALQRASGRVDAWTAGEQKVVTAGSRYIDWLVPGLLGMNVMGTGLWGIGFSIVQARMKKLLKRLVATPMRRGHYLLAQMLGRLVFLALEVSALLVFAWLAFSVPINGSVLDIALLSLLGALSFGGLGLLLASRAKTVEGLSGMLNFVMLPMWILSGVFFSSSNFPAAVQPAIRMLPLTALNEALRGVMLDGARLGALWPQVAILTGWGAMSFAAALKIFRWR